MDSGDYKERQDSEMTAIKAIYDPDVRDYGKSRISLQLFPQRGSNDSTNPVSIKTILMTLEFPFNYPDEAPVISLSEAKGLTSQEITELKIELDKLATTCLGKEMVLDIAQHAEIYLYMHPKSRADLLDDKHVQSKEEPVPTNLENQEIEETDAGPMKTSLRYQAYRPGPQNEIIQDGNLPSSNEGSPARGDLFLQSDSASQRGIRRQNMRIKSEDSICSHLATIEFSSNKGTKTIQRGELLGEMSIGGGKVYSGMDTTSGNLIALYEWILGDRQITGSVEAASQQLSTELNLLQELDHINIVSYLGIKFITDDVGNTCLTVAQEFIRGTTLKSFRQVNVALDLAHVQYLAQRILQALNYLHSNYIDNRYLRDTSVFIDHSGEVKVGDYGIENKIADLYKGFTGILENDFDNTDDIYRFGVLILSLLKGPNETQNSLDIPLSLPADLKDFLQRCLATEEQSRWTSTKLQDHTFLKMKLLKGPLSGYSGENRVHVYEGMSRLQSDFEEIQWLGKGAFGDVHKVKNKLDGGIYALKRVKLNEKNKKENKKMTREVVLLSQLNHENVVRYYNSWIETDNTKTYLCSTRNSSRRTEIHQSSILNVPLRNRGVSDESDFIEFENGHNDLTPGWGKSDLSATLTGEVSTSMESKTYGLEEDDEFTDGSDVNDLGRQSIYIIMEFCEKSTLRTAIDDGLYKDVSRVRRLFREIVNGLNHIHQKEMIHRDLKPDNIFLDTNDRVKIGDFGLATNISNNPGKLLYSGGNQISVDKSTDARMTGHVGTTLYAAPETESSGSEAGYDQKVDIYSLGIILFEMVYPPFTTRMERNNVICGLRDRNIHLPRNFWMMELPPEIPSILRWVLKHDPRKRPTSSVLNSFESLDQSWRLYLSPIMGA